MNKLLQRGVLTHSSLLDYLSYTTRVYQLLSVHDTRSVFLYDREYRKLQTLHSFRWGTDVPHLQMVHLRPKSLQNFQNNLAPKTRSNSQPYPPRVSHKALRFVNALMGERAVVLLGVVLIILAQCQAVGRHTQHTIMHPPPDQKTNRYKTLSWLEFCSLGRRIAR